jgi:hypothetical protein
MDSCEEVLTDEQAPDWFTAYYETVHGIRFRFPNPVTAILTQSRAMVRGTTTATNVNALVGLSPLIDHTIRPRTSPKHTSWNSMNLPNN